MDRDFLLDTTGTSAARASAYVSQEVPYSVGPDNASAASIVAWGAVSVGKAFVFQTSSDPLYLPPDAVSATATSSSGLFYGADLAPVQIFATVGQGSTPVPPPTGEAGSQLKFYWG